jgi:hypothetical protein
MKSVFDFFWNLTPTQWLAIGTAIVTLLQEVRHIIQTGTIFPTNGQTGIINNNSTPPKIPPLALLLCAILSLYLSACGTLDVAAPGFSMHFDNPLPGNGTASTGNAKGATVITGGSINTTPTTQPAMTVTLPNGVQIK